MTGRVCHLISRRLPFQLMNEAMEALLDSRIFTTLGAQYLWAYLRISNYVCETPISRYDFVVFGITLRLELSVTIKTLRRYITEALKALITAGHKLDFSIKKLVFTLINGIPEPTTARIRHSLTYCGIKWEHIKQ